MISNRIPKLPHVEIMVLNYNGEDYLGECIESLFRTDYPDYSVMVIDNDSADGSMDLIRSRYPSVITIENKENLGFGKAYHLAIRDSSSEFFVLLNNDTKVEPGWLRPLVRAMLTDDRMAAASSKLLFMDHPRVINHAGGGMNFIGLGFDLGMFDPDGDEYLSLREVFFPSGAACLIRKSAYKECRGFDSRFFMYHEDVDLGWRFQLMGYRVCCIPESRVYHAFGGSSLKFSDMSFRNNLGYRHALRSLVKNYEPANLARYLPLLAALGIRSYFRDRSINFPRCLLWNLRYFPSTLRERYLIQKSRKRTDAQIASNIWPHLQLPVYFPDYPIQSLSSFARSESTNRDVVMNSIPEENLGYGWYPPDRLEKQGLWYRWSRREAVIYFLAGRGRSKIVIQALAMSASLGRSRVFSLYIGDELVKSFTIDSDHIEFVELDYSGPEGPVELRIQCQETWSPDEVYGNGDRRRLGLGLVRISVADEALDKRPYRGMSVIIPTYNRAENLQKVLNALADQTLPGEFYEIIVVDDGSTDETRNVVENSMRSSSMELRYLWQENKKQGAARNRGLKHAQMPLVVFIGDDIIPSRDFLANHLNRHNSENTDDRLVVIGHTKWSREKSITPFMEYIHEYGYQFGFSIMEDSNDLPFNFFYTSNISLSTDFLEAQDMVFDEDFDSYGWEDIELGYRLKLQGMRLCFESGATAYHEHPTDVRSFCLRQFNVGMSSRSFLQKHPELETFLGGEDLDRWLKYRTPVKLLSYLAGFLDQKNVRLPHRIYKLILHTSYCLGVHGQRYRDGLTP